MITDTEIRDITEYQLRASNGKPVRKATRVIFADGYKIDYLERLSKQTARVQAMQQRIRDLGNDVCISGVRVTREELPRQGQFVDTACVECGDGFGFHVIGRQIKAVEQVCDCELNVAMFEAMVANLERDHATDNPENYTQGGTFLGLTYNQFYF